MPWPIKQRNNEVSSVIHVKVVEGSHYLKVGYVSLATPTLGLFIIHYHEAVIKLATFYGRQSRIETCYKAK